METLLGKALGDLAALVSTKWFAGMGLIGLVILTWVLLNGSPHDDVLVAAIGVTMFGFGFAEAETRSFQERIGHGFKITAPIRRLKPVGAVLYLIGTIGAITALIRGAFLIF